MKIFSKLVRNSENNNPRLKKAIEIVDKLGHEKETYSASLALSGGYYRDYIYEDYGLKIVKPDFRHDENTNVYVNFNGQRVLDSNTYIPGRWEEVFNELYQSIDVILHKIKRTEDLLSHEKQLLSYLSQLGGDETLNIENGLTVKLTNFTSGYYDEHDNGTRYQVYYYGDEVFDAYRGTIYKEDSFYTYEPGEWENVLKNYVNYEKYRETRRKQLQADHFATENIKKLRKLRENK